MDEITKRKIQIQALTLANTKEKHPFYDHVVRLRKELFAYITGAGIGAYIKRYTPREDKAAHKLRIDLTNSINPAICSSLVKPIYKVSRNNNVAKKYDFKLPKINDKVAVMMNDFNGRKVDNTDGFESWMKTRYVEISYTDPNKFIVAEWDAVSPTETIKPRPFEVSCDDAFNFEYKGEELQWLFIRTFIKFNTQDAGGKITAKKGEKYTLYAIGLTVTIEPIDKVFRERQGLFLLPNQEYIKIGELDFLQTSYETKLTFVPAIRIGYFRDLETDGATFVNPFHPAMPYLRKALKTTSELDLTMSGHVFPQKLQYVQECRGSDMSKPCNKGKDPEGNNCTACNGTGRQMLLSSMDVLTLPMPDDPKDMIPLDQILVYKSPPIELVKFQKEYEGELKADSHLAVYNSNMFISPDAQFAKTATEVESNMDGIYDAIEPYTEQFSTVWKYFVYTFACLAGFDQETDDFDLVHSYPPDPKLKTLSMLLAELKSINESGAPSFMRDLTNQDIAEIVYNGDEEALKKYQVKRLFYPFNGMSAEQITMQLASQFVSEYAKILHSNFESIFTDLEKGNKDFYLLNYAKQDELVQAMVERYKSEILTNSPTPISFQTPGAGADDDEPGSGDNGANPGDEGADDPNPGETEDSEV